MLCKISTVIHQDINEEPTPDLFVNNLVVGLIIDSFIDEMDDIESENNAAVVKDNLNGGQHVLLDANKLS